jgi:hypothetical protein
MNWPFIYSGQSPFDNWGPIPRYSLPKGSSSSGSSNDSLQKLIDQFTGKVTEGTAQNAWRRENPTDVNQLLKQLSFNAGEMGMPGGYVGGVQMPSYQMPGPQLPAINNPDMKMYGRTPGYGEATFYRQSMKGGMAPIAAMSPLGVPTDWKPGGNYTAPSSSLQSLVDAYKANPTGATSSSKSTLQKQLEDYLKSLSGDTSKKSEDEDD